jgi:hypothetical protein
MINHIHKSCGIIANTRHREQYIIKHIASKLFYLHELWKIWRINILRVKSCDNLDDLFTKSLPTLTFHKIFMELVFDGLRIWKNQGEYLPDLLLFKASCCTLFSFMSLLSRFSSRFLMR